jgi:Multiubiquitin
MTSIQDETSGEQRGDAVTVTVNNKPVALPRHRVTGLEVKEAAIDQGVEIQLDFILTLEAHDGEPARTVDNDAFVTVTRDSAFTANDGDDDA